MCDNVCVKLNVVVPVDIATIDDISRKPSRKNASKNTLTVSQKSFKPSTRELKH